MLVTKLRGRLLQQHAERSVVQGLGSDHKPAPLIAHIHNQKPSRHVFGHPTSAIDLRIAEHVLVERIPAGDAMQVQPLQCLVHLLWHPYPHCATARTTEFHTNHKITITLSALAWIQPPPRAALCAKRRRRALAMALTQGRTLLRGANLQHRKMPARHTAVSFRCECHELESYMFSYHISDTEGARDPRFRTKSRVSWRYRYSMKAWRRMNETFGSLLEDAFFGVDGWYIHSFMCNYVEHRGRRRALLNDFAHGLGSCSSWMNESMGGWIYDLVGWMIILIS